MTHFRTLLLLSAATALTSAQAELAGNQSTPVNATNYLFVGGTNYVSDPNIANGHIGTSGSPGIMVNKMSPNKEDRKYVSLFGLQVVAWPDFNGISHIDSEHRLIPKKHRNKVGTLDFSRVRLFGGEVYFGEWSQNGEKNAADRQVWYVGKDKTANMPSSGRITYNVKGIRNYQHDGILRGTLTADFGRSRVTGNVGDITFGNNVVINAGDASFAGGVNVAATKGNTQGNFFGDGARDIAGIATFKGNRNLDTAFGGKKQ